MTPLLKFQLFFITVFLIANFGGKATAQSSATKSFFDAEKAKKEIVVQNKIFSDALAKSDSVTVASIYTQDAKIFNHAVPTTNGHAEVISYYGEIIRAGITKFNYTTVGVWGSDNNLVVEEGALTFSFPDGKVAVKGRYMIVWKRDGGKLKIFRDSFSADGKK